MYLALVLRISLDIKRGFKSHKAKYAYRKFSNIKRTKPPNVDVFRRVVQLSSPNPMKPGVKSRMKM